MNAKSLPWFNLIFLNKILDLAVTNNDNMWFKFNFSAQQVPNASKLIDNLLNDYDKRLRPNFSSTKILSYKQQANKLIILINLFFFLICQIFQWMCASACTFYHFTRSQTMKWNSRWNFTFDNTGTIHAWHSRKLAS